MADELIGESPQARDVEVVTSADTLLRVLREFWPSCKTTRQQVEAWMLDLPAVPVSAYRPAIAAAWREAPDGRRPPLQRIRELLRARANAEAQMRPKRPTAPIRARWDRWPAATRPAWALELIRADDSDLITASDWERWDDAWQLVQGYEARWRSTAIDMHGQPLPWLGPGVNEAISKLERPTVLECGNKRTEIVNLRTAAARGQLPDFVRERWLRRCHMLLRSLPHYGPESRRWRDWWVAYLERDARAGGITLANPAVDVSDAPF